jgi:hypothetical protein
VLHSGCVELLEVALNDTDLQRLIIAWDGLPSAIRKALLALVGSVE